MERIRFHVAFALLALLFFALAIFVILLRSHRPKLDESTCTTFLSRVIATSNVVCMLNHLHAGIAYYLRTKRKEQKITFKDRASLNSPKQWCSVRYNATHCTREWLTYFQKSATCFRFTSNGVKRKETSGDIINKRREVFRSKVSLQFEERGNKFEASQVVIMVKSLSGVVIFAAAAQAAFLAPKSSFGVVGPSSLSIAANDPSLQPEVMGSPQWVEKLSADRDREASMRSSRAKESTQARRPTPQIPDWWKSGSASYRPKQDGVQVPDVASHVMIDSRDSDKWISDPKTGLLVRDVMNREQTQRYQQPQQLPQTTDNKEEESYAESLKKDWEARNKESSSSEENKD